MVDTIRDRATLITLLVDNVSGDISAQDMRDVLVSVHGVYGQIYVTGGAAAQSLTTTPAKLSGFTANGLGVGATPDHTNDQITVGTDGVYLVMGQFSAISETGTTYILKLRNNAVAVDQATAKFTGSMTVGDVISASFVGLANLSANDVLTVYGESDDAGGANLTLVEAQLVAHRLA